MNDWSIGRSIAPPDDGQPETKMDEEPTNRNKPGPKPKLKSGSKEIVVRIPPDLMARMNHAVEMKQFNNRSDLIREALLQFFFPVHETTPELEPITRTVSLPILNGITEQVAIGKLSFDTTYRPGWFRRKLLKWLLGVEVRG